MEEERRKREREQERERQREKTREREQQRRDRELADAKKAATKKVPVAKGILLLAWLSTYINVKITYRIAGILVGIKFGG